MNYLTFLRGIEGDFKGRFLVDIWDFTDKEIEDTHDFIQIVFPLNEPSKHSINRHFLDDKLVIDQIRCDEIIKNNLVKSSKWFLSFLSRNHQWRIGHDHNHLRITRIIRCLRLLVSDNEADDFHLSILRLVEGNNLVNKETLEFWEKS